MKTFLLILLALIIQIQSFAKGDSMEQILGNWLGNLKINERNSLRITFTITINKKDNKLTGVMGSPDQLAMNIPLDMVDYKEDKLVIELKKLNINFTGKLIKNKLKGVFKQNGASFPLELFKIKSIKSVGKTYKQTPKKPYPYIEEEIIFKNEEKEITYYDKSQKVNVILAGTLTYPKVTDKKKKFPAIVLISGSGPNDRNETPMKHFLLLADRLTKNGFVVLRFDKRGIGKSKGNYKRATTYSFSSDVNSAVDYLLTRDFVDKNKIGLLGHSEGAMIAPVVASVYRKDISFLILMGTPGVSGDEILIKQTYDIAKVSGIKEDKLKKMIEKDKKIYALVKKSKTSKKIDGIREEIIKISPEAKKQIKTLLSPWFVDFLRFNPEKYLKKIKIPTLILSGEKDLQVSSKENNKAIKEALDKAGNKEYEIVTFKNLNHLFQTAKTGTPSEYAKLDEIINEKVLEKIINWLNKKVK